MKKNTSYLGQALTDSFSIIGGVVFFYILLSFFTGNDNLIVEGRNKIFLIILFIGIAIGRYLQYKKK